MMSGELPLGEPLEWTPVGRPLREPLKGRRVLVRPVDPDADAAPLYAISHPPDGDAAIWTYLPDGPYESVEQLRRTLTWARDVEGAVYFTLVRASDGRPLGMVAYLRIEPDLGVLEIGHVWLGVELQRTSAATEAIYLLLRHAFDELGYRRVEWKCNELNAASKRAAERLGFSFEGVFHQHMVVKGRNRDTAWFAMIDKDWPAIRAGFEVWLADENFDEGGRQRRRLRELMVRQAQSFDG